MTWQRCAARRTKHRIVWLHPDAVLANHSWRTDESGCSWRKRKRRATAALQGQYRACAPQRAALVSSVIARVRTKVGGCVSDAIRVLEASRTAGNLGGNGSDPGRNLLTRSVQSRRRGRSRRQHRCPHERTDQDGGRVPHPPTRGLQSILSTRLSYSIAHRACASALY